ncbi:ORF6N domain-containing protein [Algoriphagus aestuariicola]|nr:ORF6N domain-containing protein [Algoriphagus aestuariicola]
MKEHIEEKIYTIRGVQVMLDQDLAGLYQVTTSRLNEQVKRNKSRFPDSFVFQLTEAEWRNLIAQLNIPGGNTLTSQIATSSRRHGGRRHLPYAFTEQGVAMLSAVLRSEVAVQVSIQIMQAFVNMRSFLLKNASVFQRLDQLELKQLKTEAKFEEVFRALESRQDKPEKGIFFDSQIFDAYVFVAELIKNAKQEIILIDNYVDESVLLLLSKRDPGVQATIYTKTSKQLELDLKKHQAQYATVAIKPLEKSHDRFMIIDRRELYHIGASLKDLGKKWFAFSRMNGMTAILLAQLEVERSKADNSI